jgi:hypothetical protein
MMNNEFYKYAVDLIDSLTTEELEVGLREFGIACQRRVSVVSEQEVDVLGSMGISSPVTNNRDFLFGAELVSTEFAANDNSYALAA